MELSIQLLIARFYDCHCSCCDIRSWVRLTRKVVEKMLAPRACDVQQKFRGSSEFLSKRDTAISKNDTFYSIITLQLRAKPQRHHSTASLISIAILTVS